MRCVTLAVCLLVVQSRGFSGTPKDRDPDQIGQRNIGGGVNLYSRAHEVELGRDLARDVERQASILEDPVVAEYVNRITQNLARNSDSRFLFTVKIIRSDDVNAFALPGGFLFVTTGLLRAIDNEAELASALSHEIAHVAARHYTNQASWAQIVELASVPLVFVGGWPGFALQRGMQVATPLAFRKYSRMAESQADELGLQYLYQTGYDPVAFVDFFERMARKEDNPGRFGQLLSLHPRLQSRIRAAQKQMQNDFRPRSRYLIQTSEFETVRERLSKIEKHIPVPWPRYVPAGADGPPILRRHD
jgi:predicted Zn-dependent protease